MKNVIKYPPMAISQSNLSLFESLTLAYIRIKQHKIPPIDYKNTIY